MSTAVKESEFYTMRSLPGVTINVKPMARDFYEMFDEQEKTILRIGMLPAKKMELLEKCLRDKYMGLGVPASTFYGDTVKCCDWYGKKKTADMIVVALAEPSRDGEMFIDCDVSEAVREAVRQITLEIYSIGNLVV